MSQRDDDAPGGSPVRGLRRGLGRRLRGVAGRAAGRLLGRDQAPAVPDVAAVVFETGAGRVSGDVPGGVSLLAAAAKLDVRISHYCGGMCSCGTCRVEIVQGAENLSRPLGNERMVVGGQRDEAGDRLACQARVLGPVVVRVPDWF